MNARIVQIATCKAAVCRTDTRNADGTTHTISTFDTLYALCEDGTIWEWHPARRLWVRIPIENWVTG